MARQSPTALFVFSLAVALALTPALSACTAAPKIDSTGSALAQVAGEEIVGSLIVAICAAQSPQSCASSSHRGPPARPQEGQ